MALDEARRRALAAAGLALLCAAVFWPMREHALLNYDDAVYITGNPAVTSGLDVDGVVWAFTTFHGSNWFPLTRLSWMLDMELGAGDPKAFHTTSLALHALTTAFLFLALTRLTGREARSAFVAAVFALHPLHVESVAWASARKDTLSGLLFACALLAYAPGRGSRGSRARRGLVFVLLALGLMAKPVLVTLPFLLLLLDDWPLLRLRRAGRPDAEALRAAIFEKLPLFSLVAVFCVVTIVAQRAGGALADLEALPLSTRLANAPVACAGYLVKALFPTDLAVFYPHRQGGLPAWQVIGSTALVASLSILALRAARTPSALAIGWFWYLGMLVPVIGLVQVGSQAMADRYTYLPLVGLAIAVTWGACDLAARALPDARRRFRLLATLGTAAVATLGVGSSFQLRHWRDSEALMRRALDATRDNYVAHAYLGAAILEQGRVGEAILHWRESARLAPGYVTVANNLAWLLATTPDPRFRAPAEAVALASRAARLAPEDPAVLDTLAAAQASAGRYPAAVATAQRAAGLARERGDIGLASQIEAREALYRRGAPHRGR